MMHTTSTDNHCSSGEHGDALIGRPLSVPHAFRPLPIAAPRRRRPDIALHESTTNESTTTDTVAAMPQPAVRRAPPPRVPPKPRASTVTYENVPHMSDALPSTSAHHPYENISVIEADESHDRLTDIPQFRANVPRSAAADRASRNDIYNVDVLQQVIERTNERHCGGTLVRQSVNLMAFDEHDTLPDNIWRDELSDDDHSLTTSVADKLTINGDDLRLELQPEEDTLPDITPTRLSTTPSMSTPDRSSDGQNVCFSGWLAVTKEKFARHNCLVKYWTQLHKAVLIFSTSDTDVDVQPLAAIPCADIVSLVRTCAPSLAGKATRPASVPSTTTPSNAIQIHFRTSATLMHRVLPCSSIAGSAHLLAVTLVCPTVADVDHWMLLLTKACAVSSVAAEIVDGRVQCMGRIYARQCTSGQWQSAWAFVASNKRLTYALHADVGNVYEVDLCRVLRINPSVVNRNEWCPKEIMSTGSVVHGPLLISTRGSSLYMQCEHDVVTQQWRDALHAELTRRTNRLSEQRVTDDGIPYVISKCLKFISSHGIHQEGLYRKSGPAREVTALMTLFDDDPVDFVLRYENDESMNSVCEALRRYFRQLSEPLLTNHLRPRFLAVCSAAHSSQSELIAAYKTTLLLLPSVNYATLRCLLAHLVDVCAQCDVNKASVMNVARVFGPTLMNNHHASIPLTAAGKRGDPLTALSFGETEIQIRVLFDLITHYVDMFDVTDVEMRARHRVNECASRILPDVIAQRHKPAAGMLIAIHLFERDINAFNVQSTLSAADVLAYAMQHKSLDVALGPYALVEAARDGQLERVISPRETIHSIALERWVDWGDETTRSYLIVKHDAWTADVAAATPYPFASDVRVADAGSRTFKRVALQYAQGRVCMHKNANKLSKPIREWAVESLLWFHGAEVKRDAPTLHTLTFMDGRTDASPPSVPMSKRKHVGVCVAFEQRADMLRWLAAVTSDVRNA